ncbi:hypothetical protein H3293_23300, partial [Providencia stuartii]|nr:hypothetical protein [Providencia stuartii]
MPNTVLAIFTASGTPADVLTAENLTRWYQLLRTGFLMHQLLHWLFLFLAYQAYFF